MNQEIRDRIKESRVKQWEVAKAIGISEGTLCIWLRDELSEERKAQVMEAIRTVEEAIKC